MGTHLNDGDKIYHQAYNTTFHQRMEAVQDNKALAITNAIWAMPHPEVFCYHLNCMGAQKNAPKKILVSSFSIYISCKNKMKYSPQIHKNKKFFKRHKILPQMHWTSNIFGPSATTIEGFWVSLNYPILNFKKTVCSKYVWIRHWWDSSKEKLYQE